MEAAVQSYVSLCYSTEWGHRCPLPQRGGSNRYSKSGCRSLCSLFLFLANSLSMAITSVSNSAGVGFASEGKMEKSAPCSPILVFWGPIPVSQGRTTHTSGPVINVPVVAGLVYEAVVAV